VTNKKESIPVLAVRQPWTGLITSGKKITEIRGYPGPKKYIGKKIAIYASRTKPLPAEIDHCLKMNYRLYGSYFLPHLCDTRGVILATATLSSSLKCTGWQDFDCWEHEHWNPLDYYRKDKTYYWHLDDVKPLKNPVPFKFSGSIVWSSIEVEKLTEFLDKSL
jgi:hypothetical protein